MTIARFLTYIQYSTINPGGIFQPRWDAMIKWAITQGYIK